MPWQEETLSTNCCVPCKCHDMVLGYLMVFSIFPNNCAFSLVQYTESGCSGSPKKLSTWPRPQLVYAVANSQKMIDHLLIKSIT